MKFLNARSPLRLLEKGLHGGLGPGNLGVVLAGARRRQDLVPGGGGGRRAAALRGACCTSPWTRTVAHVRAHYDTVFEDLASDHAIWRTRRVVHGGDRSARRSIRVYPPELALGVREAPRRRQARDRGGRRRPSLLVLEGLDVARSSIEEDIAGHAQSLARESWRSRGVDRGALQRGGARRRDVPASIAAASAT